jgi:hypothetical protein
MDQKFPKELYVIILVILVIVFVWVFISATSEIFNPPGPSMLITKINESGIPDGEIIQLSEEDFKEFPFLAPIIRDNSQHEVSSNKNRTRINYYVELSWAEKDKILASKFFARSNKFFEYRGNYYSFDLERPNPNMTIIKMNESGVPDGEIVLLSEEDFKEFPYLAPVIRDDSQEGVSIKNGTRIDYFVTLSGMETGKIWQSKFFSRREKFFEYMGNYYSFGYPAIP